jgi:2,3-bisphosphoglycerate-dependent phosphoglycerate mutase
MSRCIAILLRHGDYHQLANTPSAHQPFALNDEGRVQAGNAISLLNEMTKTNGWMLDPVIHSSNLQRSWETASIIADGLSNIESVATYDELAERGLGCAANLTTRQIEEVVEQDSRFEKLPENWKSDSYYCLPLQGAESLMDAGKRVAEHLLKAMLEIRLSDNTEQDIAKIFIGHGAAFRHAAFQLGVLQFEQLKLLSMFHAKPLALEFNAEQNWTQIVGEWKVRSNQDINVD